MVRITTEATKVPGSTKFIMAISVDFVCNKTSTEGGLVFWVMYKGLSYWDVKGTGQQRKTKSLCENWQTFLRKRLEDVQCSTQF